MRETTEWKRREKRSQTDGRTDEQRTNEHHKKIGRKSRERGEFYRRERGPANCAIVVVLKVAT